MSTFIRSFITIFLFSSFIVLWISAWRRGNAGHFDAAARLPLEESTDMLAGNDHSAANSTADQCS